MDTAKVFMTGRSQAVRLPKAYRFDGTEVRIRREGRAVILEPVEDDWDSIMAQVAAAGPFDEDMVEAALDRPGPDAYERPDIDLDT